MSVANLKGIVSLIITHGINNTQWVLINNNNSNGYFEQISIDEGLEQNIPSGTLLIRDVGDSLKNFNFSGRDGLSITIDDINPISGQSERKQLFFIIYQVSQATDFSDRNQPRIVALKFIDQLYFYNERRPFVYEEDCKLISLEEDDSSTTMGLDAWANKIIKTFSSIGGVKDGLPSILPYNIDSSKNYAWLKEKQHIYPSGRKIDFDNVLVLLNYLASNAVDSNNSPNFFCWKDIFSFNFKSYSSMIDSSTSTLLKTGTIDAIYNDRIKINSVQNIPNLSFMELENNGAFCSYYERVDPDFSNPYFNFSDVSKGYTKYPVVYALNKDFRMGGRVFPDGSITMQEDGDADPLQIALGIEFDIINNLAGITGINITPKRFYDDGQWGYFDKGYFNNSIPEQSYSIYTEQGITFKYQNTNRRSSDLWQSMFDIEELNPIAGSTLQIASAESPTNPQGNSYQNINFIQKFIEIKKGISAARHEYYSLRELKERWNIFKYVVCCINNTSDSFYAIILGATALGGGDELIPINPIPSKSKAFKYIWKEVEFVPKGYEGVSGGTLSFVYPKFAGSSASSGGCTCGIPTGISGIAGITGITFHFAHPYFEIFIPNNSRSGGFTGVIAGFTANYGQGQGNTFIKIPTYGYFPAFNINEITNYETKQALDPNPRKYAGPGINMDLEQFPQGNKIIPVGYNPTIDDPCKHEFNGQIVKMQQINIKDLTGLSLSQKDINAAPVLYFFDVQNAVEGQCEDCPTEG